MGERIAIARAELDTSQFPIVVLVECGVLSDQERVGVMESLEELVERRGRHALVLDLTQAGVVPHAQRTYIAEALQLRGHQFVQKWAAVAIIVRNPVLTHLPKAAFWLKALPVQSRMFVDRQEATTWARGCATLESSGAMPVAPHVEAKRRDQ